MTNTTVGNSIKQEEVLAELNINVLSGKDLRNTVFFGKMDPYVVFEYRKMKYKTEADPEGHIEPIWNEKVNVPIYSFDEEIKIECKEYGIFFDELICSTVLKLSEFQENHNSEFDIPLYYKNEIAGNLKLFCFVNNKKQPQSLISMKTMKKSKLARELTLFNSVDDA